MKGWTATGNYTELQEKEADKIKKDEIKKKSMQGEASRYEVKDEIKKKSMQGS